MAALVRGALLPPACSPCIALRGQRCLLPVALPRAVGHSACSASVVRPARWHAAVGAPASSGRGAPLLVAGLAGAVGLGLGGSVAAQCQSVEEEVVDAGALLARVLVVPFGVLGSQLRRDRKVSQVGPLPDAQTAVVDSGGHWVPTPGGPRRAGGAAKSTYKWISISEDDGFPLDVAASVHFAGDAKYHDYGGGRHIIHAFGPDLRQIPNAWDEAVSFLATIYENVLREFADSGLPVLRLLPVSGGIYAGSYAPRMPELAAAALRVAFGRLPEFAGTAALPAQLLCGQREIHYCIFMEAELEAFTQALTAP